MSKLSALAALNDDQLKLGWQLHGQVCGLLPFEDTVGVAGTPLKIDLKISTDGPSGLLQLTPECGRAELSLRIVLRLQHDDANPTPLLTLLRTNDKGITCRSTCKHKDYFA